MTTSLLLSTFTSPTGLYFLVFGALSLAMGVQGYRAAGSKASLIAGGISGLILLVAGFLCISGGEKVKSGHIIGLVISVALLGKFLPAYLKTKKLYPAGIMAAAALLGLVAAAIGLR